VSRFRILLPLTLEDGRRVFVSPPHIRLAMVIDNGASIEFGDGASIQVREQAEVIAMLVDKWLATAYLGDRYDR
jgi:hypothetical protein